MTFKLWLPRSSNVRRWDNLSSFVYGLSVTMRPQFADTNAPQLHTGRENLKETVREMLSHHDSEAAHRMPPFVESDIARSDNSLF